MRRQDRTQTRGVCWTEQKFHNILNGDKYSVLSNIFRSIFWIYSVRIDCLLSLSPILTNTPRTSTSMQHPAMPIQMTPVGFPEPLSTEADGYRRLLASWIAQAQPRVDYYYDDRGNRVYCRDRIRPMVQPLLRAMGLSVSQLTIVQYQVL